MPTITRAIHFFLTLLFAFTIVSEAPAQSSKSIVGGESPYYVLATDKSFDQATKDLESAVKRHGFSVLYVHDLGETFRSKGIAFTE
jgi:hypothetical protein